MRDDLSRYRDGTTLTCGAVPTFVRTLGAGPPVIAVHGGPGFSHDYLVDPLHSLAERRTVIFYDQPGCGRSGAPTDQLTPDLAAEQLRALIRHLIPEGEPVGLLAHSWGGFVALAADLSKATGVRVAEGLIVTPVAPTRSDWDAAVAGLLGRIPAETAGAIMTELATQAETSFDPLLPFYCAEPPRSGVGALRVRGHVYLAMIERLGPFDLRSQAGRLLPSLDLLLGRFDITPPDLLGDMVSAARATTTLDTGHFPFWEDPVGFERVLQQAFA